MQDWILQHPICAPWGTRPHPIVCRPSVCMGLRGRWPCFSPFCRMAPLWGNSADIHEYISQWLWWRSISLHGDPVEGHGGGSLTGNSEGKMNFQGMGCKRLCRQMFIFVGAPLGNLGKGSIYRELWGIVEGGLQKWSISLYGSSVRGTWRCTRRLWRWAPLSMGASLGNLGEGSYAGGLCLEEDSGTCVSPCRGPLGNLGRGVHLPGTLKISWKRALAIEHLSLWDLC